MKHKNMRKLFVAIMLFALTESSGQTFDFNKLPYQDTTIQKKEPFKISDNIGIATTTTGIFTLQQPVQFRTIVYGKDVTEVFRFTSDGKIFYNPKYLCACRKCKNYKGMKELRF